MPSSRRSPFSDIGNTVVSKSPILAKISQPMPLIKSNRRTAPDSTPAPTTFRKRSRYLRRRHTGIVEGQGSGFETEEDFIFLEADRDAEATTSAPTTTELTSQDVGIEHDYEFVDLRGCFETELSHVASPDSLPLPQFDSSDSQSSSCHTIPVGSISEILIPSKGNDASDCGDKQAHLYSSPTRFTIDTLEDEDGAPRLPPGFLENLEAMEKMLVDHGHEDKTHRNLPSMQIPAIVVTCSREDIISGLNIVLNGSSSVGHEDLNGFYHSQDTSINLYGGLCITISPTAEYLQVPEVDSRGRAIGYIPLPISIIDREKLRLGALRSLLAWLKTWSGSKKVNEPCGSEESSSSSEGGAS